MAYTIFLAIFQKIHRETIDMGQVVKIVQPDNKCKKVIQGDMQECSREKSKAFVKSMKQYSIKIQPGGNILVPH